MMKKILFEDALILKTVKTLRVLAHIFPLRLSFAIARTVGSAVYFLSKRRKIAYKNLRAAFSKEKTRAEMKEIAYRSLQNLSMSAIELLRFPDMDEAYIKKNIRIIGSQKIDEKLKEGKGAIFLTAHFGCWELLNLASNLVGYPIVVLARTQKHPRSDEFLNSLRMSKGNQIIHKGMPVREILKALKAGKIVGMLSDQDGGKNGTFVNFFNRLSSSPSGVATFALRTHAPIFPVFIFREGGAQHRVDVGDPLIRPDESSSPEEAERYIMQQFASILESKIRKAPDQWLWAHRRWKSTPDRTVVVLSDGKVGHFNQSMALFEAVKQERILRGFSSDSVHLSIREVRFKSKTHDNCSRAIHWLFCGKVPFRRFFSKLVLTPECYNELAKTYADIVISSGSSLLGANLLVSAENQAKSCVVMKPYFSTRRFDAVVIPRHDGGANAKNVFVTDLSLTSITEGLLKQETDNLRKSISKEVNGKKIGLLVGGDTGNMKFDRSKFSQLLEELYEKGAQQNALFLVTSSRRTPKWADEALKRTFANKPACLMLVIANEANRNGVVPGILGMSDAVVVTGESISMVTEAVVSKKHVFVMNPFNDRDLKAKHKEFLTRLEVAGLITRMDGFSGILMSAQNSIDSKVNAVLVKDRETLQEAARRVV